MQSWYKKSALTSLFTIPVGRATGQRFWDAMDRLPMDSIPSIEEDLWGTILEEFSIPLDVLIQVGLAVSVVRGLGLPLINGLYGGSEHDATLFPSAISRTVERVRELSSLSLRLWVTRSGKLFKIISDRSKLQEKLFAILALQKIASALGAQTDSS